MQHFSEDATIFFAPENMKKKPSKVAHNRPPPFFFSIANRPKTSPNLIFCFIKMSPYATMTFICKCEKCFQFYMALFTSHFLTVMGRAPFASKLPVTRIAQFCCKWKPFFLYKGFNWTHLRIFSHIFDRVPYMCVKKSFSEFN